MATDSLIVRPLGAVPRASPILVTAATGPAARMTPEVVRTAVARDSELAPLGTEAEASAVLEVVDRPVPPLTVLIHPAVGAGGVVVEGAVVRDGAEQADLSAGPTELLEGDADAVPDALLQTVRTHVGEPHIAVIPLGEATRDVMRLFIQVERNEGAVLPDVATEVALFWTDTAADAGELDTPLVRETRAVHAAQVALHGVRPTSC